MRRTGAAVRPLAVGAVLVMVAGCGDDGDTAGSEEEMPSLTTVVPRPELAGEGLPPYNEPDDDGEILVVESGFSVFADEFDDESATYGFVVENTSEMVAFYTDIRVAVLDGSGQPIATPEIMTPAMVLPGEQFGAGGSVDIEDVEPEELEVEIAGSQWYPMESRFLEFATLTTEDVTADELPTLASPLELSFTVQSEYESDLWATGTAILRDEAGDIVGGADLDGAVEIEPGTSEGQLSSDDFQELPPLEEPEIDVYLVPDTPVPAPGYGSEAG